MDNIGFYNLTFVQKFIYHFMIEEGKYLPVIDKVFTLEEIVQAHHHVEKGHKTGDVVITIDPMDGD